MTQDIPPAWSPSDDLKLIKGIKNNFSFDAISTVLGHSVLDIQRRFVTLDLYQPVHRNMADMKEVTLEPKAYVNISCLTAIGAYFLRELQDLGWVEQIHQGSKSLRSPEWWVNGKSVILHNRDENDLTLGPVRASYLLNQAKPWTPQDLDLMLLTIRKGCDQKTLTQALMRSMASIVQYLSDSGLVIIGAEEDSEEAKVWLCAHVLPRYLVKSRFYDILPLLNNGWKIDGEKLRAPSWWSGGHLLEALLPNDADAVSGQPLQAESPQPVPEVTNVSGQLGQHAEPDMSPSVSEAIGSQSPLCQSAIKGSAARPDEQNEPARSGTKWFKGNYQFLLTLLKEHHDAHYISSKMSRKLTAITSRIQHIGLAKFIKDSQHPAGAIVLCHELSIDKLRTQPPFIKEQLIQAGWVEEDSKLLVAPTWWLTYPHELPFQTK